MLRQKQGIFKMRLPWQAYEGATPAAQLAAVSPPSGTPGPQYLTTEEQNA